MSDLISRQDAINAPIKMVSEGLEWVPVYHLKELPSAEPERWDTCFSCPLSHGCPVINGCTNEQAMEYAGEIPDNCPLNAQSERKKGKWIVTSEFEDCRYVKCNQCNVTQVFYYGKPLTNYCPDCGSYNGGEDEGDE